MACRRSWIASSICRMYRSAPASARCGPHSRTCPPKYSACRRSSSARSPEASSRSWANSRTKAWRAKRTSPPGASMTRSRLLSTSEARPSRTSTSSARSGSAIACATSGDHSSASTARRRKMTCSAGVSRSWLQASVARRVCWRAGRSRAPPPDSRSSERPSRSRIALGAKRRMRAAASSMASGSPASWSTIWSTAAESAVRELQVGPHEPGPLHEQLPRVGLRQRRDRVLLLPRHAQGLARGGQHGHLGRASHELARDACPVGQELLQVVQHQQLLVLGQVVAQHIGDGPTRHLRDPDGGGDHAAHEGHVADRGQLHERHAVTEPIPHVRRHGHREARLAGPAGTRQRDHPGALEEAGHGRHLALAADEGRQRLRQVRLGDRAQRSIVVGRARHDQAVHGQRLVEVAHPSSADRLHGRPLRHDPAQALEGRVGEQDLAPVRSAGQAGRVVHVEAQVVGPVGRELGRGGVEAHAQSGPRLAGPGSIGHRAADGDRGSGA